MSQGWAVGGGVLWTDTGVLRHLTSPFLLSLPTPIPTLCEHTVFSLPERAASKALPKKQRSAPRQMQSLGFRLPQPPDCGEFDLDSFINSQVCSIMLQQHTTTPCCLPSSRFKHMTPLKVVITTDMQKRELGYAEWETHKCLCVCHITESGKPRVTWDFLLQ